jgi:sulfur-oxidizing protein SoxX
MGHEGGRRRRPPLFLVVAAVLTVQAGATSADGLAPVQIVGDAIPQSLTGQPGDPARGRHIVADRQHGLCLLCHTGPIPEQRFQGSLAPDLGGAGKRWSEGQLRLRMVDSSRLNPDTIMPAYYRIDGLTRVARAWEGRPALSAQEIEDVISYLTTLQ